MRNTHLHAEHDLKEIVKSFTELAVMRPIFLEPLHRCSHICISGIANVMKRAAEGTNSYLCLAQPKEPYITR